MLRRTASLTFLYGLLLLMALPACACLWDSDTLADEEKRLPYVVADWLDGSTSF